MKLHNNLMSDEEYIQLFMAPLIDALEGAPMTFLYGMQLKHKIGVFSNPWRKKKWKYLLDKRGDAKAPYFDAGRYWPYALCNDLRILSSLEESSLNMIAQVIPDWFFFLIFFLY